MSVVKAKLALKSYPFLLLKDLAMELLPFFLHNHFPLLLKNFSQIYKVAVISD